MRRYIFIILILVLQANFTHGFYSILGDIPFQYEVVFEGKLILESKFLYYTNNNAQFTFDYTVLTKDDTVSDDQLIVDWQFSPLRDYNISPIFALLWDNMFQSILQDISYTVMLPTDQFLVFDKQGKRHPLGYFLEILFPIISLKNQTSTSSIMLDFLDENNKQRYLILDIEGWDFFNYTRSDTIPNPLLETNKQFINELYTCYSEHNKKRLPTTFWIQNFNVSVANISKEPLSSGTMTGMYFLDRKTRMMNKATILSKFNTTMNYVQDVFSLPISIQMIGKFEIQLKTNI